MKKLIALFAALSLLACVSCGETSPDTPSKTSSAPTSSVASTDDKQYDAPEEVTREGLDIGTFDGERSSTAVCPDFIDSVNSLDSYGCEAVNVCDGLTILCYTYSVSTMPNYYEPRLAIGYLPFQPSGITIPELTSWHGLIKTEELPGYMNRYLVSGGYIAVASDSANIRVYSLKTGKVELVKSYTGEGAVLLDFKADGDRFYALYTDGENVKLGDSKINSSLKNPTVGAVGKSGKLVGLSDGETGIVVNTFSGATVKRDIDLAKLDHRVSAFASDETITFLGKVAGGNKALCAVQVAADGTETVTEHLFDDMFADPYARGTVIQSRDDALYLVTSRTNDTFDFGDASVCPISADLTLGAPLYTLAKGWHPYFRYRFDNSFVLTENLAEEATVVDYIHLF